MRQAIIDIGSNSMRLTVYETDGQAFKILFKEKAMTGLAGYVEDGVLSAEGIECAYNDLLTFRETLEALDIANVAVFATASLRNVRNTAEAVLAIKAATGYHVEVLTGEEEAFFGFRGSMQDVPLTSGAFIDIGGASTEVVSFQNDQVIREVSFPVGSLRLYKDCVKNIMPGEGSVKRIRKVIREEIDECKEFSFDDRTPLVCVGGTARAVLKLAKKMYGLPSGCHSVTPEQLHEICAKLCEGDKAMTQLLLKVEPERIHTMVPGVMILDHICRKFHAEEIIVCKYGVREGYLCQKILNK